IRQYYQTESKPRRSSNPTPSSAFEGTTHPKRQADDPIEDACDEWLDEPLEAVLPKSELDAMFSVVNMRSKSLESVLASKKVIQVRDEKPTIARPEKVPVNMGKDEDEDYLIDI
ncbi:hypothetical protein DXG01_016374, partial [Tephrocybe rancida]